MKTDAAGEAFDENSSINDKPRERWIASPGRSIASLHLGAKLALITGLSLLGMVIIMPIGLFTIRAQMLTDREAKIQQIVEIGSGILGNYYRLEIAGVLNREKAQAAALAELKSLRYDKTEYFWVNDMGPRMILHPIKPELDGKDVRDVKDSAAGPQAAE